MTAIDVTACAACGQKNRVRADARAVPHCGKCGLPLPWLAEAGLANFEAVVEHAPLPVLVDFWAPWCGPCRIVAPAVEALSRELAGKLKVVKLNTDENPALGGRFRVLSIPTLLLVDGGQERDRVVGALNLGQLRAWVATRIPVSAAGR